MHNIKIYKRFALLAFVFFGPLFVAWYLFFYADHKILRTTNHGELIRLPFQISALKLRNYQGEMIDGTSRHWVILYWDKDCHKNCKATLDKMLRLRLALGKDMPRTQAWLATEQKLPDEVVTKLSDIKGLDTQVLLLSKDVVARKLLTKPKKHIVLADPNGNVMMRYQNDDLPKFLHKDLSKLLKLSKIG